MDLMSLIARLTLDSSGYEKGLGDAEKGAKSFGDRLKGGLSAAAKVGAAAVTAVTAAATAMTKAVLDGAGEVAAYGDNIDKASQKLGISAKAYQEWDAVLQHSGTSIDSMGIGMKTLATKAAEGSDAFKALGISQKQAAKMSREELFSKTITALQNVQDENKRAQLAQELFGRSAMELGPLLNTSAADTQAMKDRVHALGGVMSNEAVKAAAAYQDSLQDMQTAFAGAKRSMLSEFLPAITTVMDGITDLFAGGGIDKLSSGIDMFVGKIGDVLPRVMDKGGKIVLALGSAIVANLPKLAEAAVSAMLTFGQGLIAQLPTLVEAGLQILVTLANSIAAALPEMVPAIVDVFLQIVEVLTDPMNLGVLIEVAVAIIAALAEGLVRAIPRLVAAAPEIVYNLAAAIVTLGPKLLEAGAELIMALARGVLSNIAQIWTAMKQIGDAIWTTISDVVSGAFNWGKDLILNFWNGIKAFVNKPIDAIKGLAGRIRAFIGFSEPEEGPLSNFHTYAPDMMDLFARGILDNQGTVTDAMNRALSWAPANAPAFRAQAPAGGEVYTTSRAGTIPQNITVIMEMDGREFARATTPYIEQEQQRVGVKLVKGGAY